jgi:hypothetical protein
VGFLGGSSIRRHETAALTEVNMFSMLLSKWFKMCVSYDSD